MNIIEKHIIGELYNNILTKGEYPKFGSPECNCNKCMFYNVTCPPSPHRAGCFHGWKKEES